MKFVASSDESESSDIQVIEDEDLELAAQIEKERKAKRAQKMKEKKEREGKTTKKQQAKRKAGRKRRVSSDEEEESEEESEDEDEVVVKKSKKPKNKKKRVESDESEDEVIVSKSKKQKKKKRKEESDEEDDEVVVSKSKKQKKKKVESEEDDDDEVVVSQSKKQKKKKEDSEEDEEETPKSKKIKNKKQRSSKSSSDDDSEDDMKTVKKRRFIAQLSDDSDDSASNGNAKKKKNKSKQRNASDESSESEEDRRSFMKKQKKKVAVSSESADEEDSGSEQRGKKKKNHELNSSESSDDSIVLPSRTAAKKRPTRSAAKNDVEEKKPKKGMIMDSSKLAKETVDAERAEKERRKRLEQKQKEFNGIELEEGEDLTEVLTGTSSQRRLKSVVLDPDDKSDPDDKVPVAVHSSLVKILKPHQAHGVQFMYDCAFESLERLETEGSGGILAHCMGLGKTLQVITFLHTVMMHDKIGEKCRRVLVVVPKNVIINWFKEFQKWLVDIDEELDTIEVNELDSCKTVEDRRQALMHWHKANAPSVMIIGYDLFRILTAEDDPKKKKPKNQRARKLAKAKEDFRLCLQNPGPDMVVCDEAHKLKNDDSALSKTMVKIFTKRRICLTGTPLQNNLMEYHCMVNFVKPGLLGTKAEFANRFVNIINRGRTRDATALEVSFMKRRCHVLYDHLKKCVDRKDYRVLTEAIPPKQEYVINVRLTQRQNDLYEAFLRDVVGSTGLSKRLLPDYHMLSRIWTHPYQLILHEQRLERERLLKEEEEEEADFIDDGDESESESEASFSSESESEQSFSEDDDDSSKKKKKKNTKSKKSAKKEKKTTRRRVVDEDDEDGEDTAMNILQDGIRQSRRLAGDEPDIRDTETPPEYTGWFAKLGLVTEDDRDDFDLSNKLVLLMDIIKKCEEIGDKLLVFSQSLESLALIKRMLEFMAGTGQWFSDGHEALNAEGETWSWLEGEDYMTIDGSVQSGKRDAVQTSFNDPENYRARLMLISTRAGSLGTNMVSANRVIIFDACWNPSHDTQSLFRVYRFGQTKPVYIYRFIAQGTMEERIYKRQVTKESTSMRVVDEAQIQRHYLDNDLTALYQFTPADPDVEISYAPPKDRLLADVLHKNQHAVVDYFEHDTLFANQEEEKLTEDEMKVAWADYEKEKVAGPRVHYGAMLPNGAGIFMGVHEQNMLQHRYEETMRVEQLQNDVLFKELQKMRSRDTGTSVKVVLLRNLLEQILPYIPEEMRGGMSEFNTHFIRLVHETDRRNETAADLLRKSLESFRTVIKMVRPIPMCREPLQRIHASFPYLFD